MDCVWSMRHMFLLARFATYQLAVLGAEVIKVESPHRPDQARLQGSDRAMTDQMMGSAYLAQSANKKAVALDLRTEVVREALLRLIDTADVLVQIFAPAHLMRLACPTRRWSRETYTNG